jgi:hypothetical protein
VNADAVISNICIRIMWLSLLGIRIRKVIKYSYYPLSAYEVMEILGLEVVIPTFTKYKKSLSIVEHYYSYHTC